MPNRVPMLLIQSNETLMAGSLPHSNPSPVFKPIIQRNDDVYAQKTLTRLIKKNRILPEFTALANFTSPPLAQLGPHFNNKRGSHSLRDDCFISAKKTPQHVQISSILRDLCGPRDEMLAGRDLDKSEEYMELLARFRRGENFRDGKVVESNEIIEDDPASLLLSPPKPKILNKYKPNKLPKVSKRYFENRRDNTGKDLNDIYQRRPMSYKEGKRQCETNSELLNRLVPPFISHEQRQSIDKRLDSITDKLYTLMSPKKENIQSIISESNSSLKTMLDVDELGDQIADSVINKDKINFTPEKIPYNNSENLDGIYINDRRRNYFSVPSLGLNTYFSQRALKNLSRRTHQIGVDI